MDQNVQSGRLKVKPKRTVKPVIAKAMAKETPADRMRKKRIALGYPDAAAAARARGWNERTYQAHESGNKEIGKKSLIKYAASYGLELDYLVSGKRHTRGKSDTMEQPPLAYRLVPLLSLEAILQVESVKEMLSLETKETILVNTSSRLGQNIRGIHAPDDSMFIPLGNDKKSIREGDEVIYDTDRKAAIGDIVVARLSNPDRIVIRKFGLARNEIRSVIRLFPAAVHYPEDTIGSPQDGLILGRVVRIQTAKNL